MDELVGLSCFIMVWYVCWEKGTWGQTARIKLLLTRLQPQSISGYSSLMPCHWLCDVWVIIFPPIQWNKFSTAANYKQLKQRDHGGLLRRGCFIRGRGEGFEWNRWSLGEEEGVKEGGLGSRSSPVSGFHKAGLSQLNGRGMTFQVQRLPITHSNRGLGSGYIRDCLSVMTPNKWSWGEVMGSKKMFCCCCFTINGYGV